MLKTLKLKSDAVELREAIHQTQNSKTHAVRPLDYARVLMLMFRYRVLDSASRM